MAGGSVKLSCGEKTADVRVEGDVAVIDGRRIPFEGARPAADLEAIRLGRESVRLRAARDGQKVLVWCAGSVYEFRRAAGRAAAAADASGDLLAPMPGRVRRVVRAAGDQVRRGEVLLILEAMKMEHAIRAPRDGVISKIFHGEGELVESGTILAEIA